MSSNGRKNQKEDKIITNNIKMIKNVNPYVNSNNKFLNHKRNRTAQTTENNDSETNETSATRRIRRQIVNTNQTDNSNDTIISKRKNKPRMNRFW